jgi:simple sugar transport system ATP-binding protein
MSGPPPSEALGCAHVWKRFGPIVANRDVSLSIARGELHAVIGENGAGKSTLMRGLYGLEPPDEGEVRLGGEVIARPSVSESIRRRVGMVHQHFMLVPSLTVAENVVLGREPRSGLFLDLARASRELAALGARYRLAVEPDRRVSTLSVGEAQRVEILKVLWRGAEVLILDEPTAVLTPGEVDELFSVLRDLARAGRAVVLVTHKLDEVLALAERVTVMRRGEVVATLPARETSSAELARAMIGHELVAVARGAEPVAPGAPVRLELRGLAADREDGTLALAGIDLAVRGGEILGVAGVEGNGQSELALATAGLITPRAGAVLLDGVDVTAASPGARRRLGLGHVPEDRHARGLILDFSVEENLLLGRAAEYAGPLALDRARLRQDAEALIARLDVRPADPTAPARRLSGGNQQKVVIGRELARPAGLSALLCAQPTRGVDVGAAARIHEELLKIRAAGAAVLLLSAELDELFQLSDRIAVLFRGRIRGLFDNPPGARAELRQRIGALMLGLKEAA